MSVEKDRAEIAKSLLQNTQYLIKCNSTCYLAVHKDLENVQRLLE